VPSRSELSRYAFAILTVAVATGIRLLLDPALGSQFLFATLFIAVLASAGFGGLGPGLLSTLLGALTAVRFTLPPEGGLTVHGPGSWLALFLYIVVSIPIAGLGDALRRARGEAEEMAERAARTEVAQRLLASIVEGSRDAIYGQSLQGTITSWNAGAEHLYGYSAGEAIGQPDSMLSPEPRRGLSAPALRHEEFAKHFEALGRRKDGAIIHVSMSVSPVRDEAGIVVGSSTIASDITLRKKAEADLVSAQEELRLGDRRKDEFLAVLAHELRNPLAPLRNALGVLRRADAAGAASVEARDMAERQVHHLTRLVDDLLDVSRITHGRIELKRQRLELSRAVAHAVESAQPAMKAQRHQLTVRLPDEAVWLYVDEMRLAQILANLLNNAVQYTPPGGHIRVEGERGISAVEIRVSDSGLGIAPEALPRIFDMFTQVSPREIRAPSSLGIGLGLVKGLVEMHGGKVEARSAGIGRGSTFVVRLPVAPGEGADRVKSMLDPTVPSRTRTVLVVDDNADAALSLAALLSLEGHMATVASDGESALAAIEAHAPEIVLLDIGMPGMDGYEVARWVRSKPHLSGLTLVAVTGWGQEHDRRMAQEAGFDHHLTKPVEPSTLLAIIDVAPDPKTRA
jgi:PAS domain S-box-containing protein